MVGNTSRKDNMNQVNTNALLVRALKTFLQGFLASVLVAVQANQTFSSASAKALLVGAVAAGVSAAMNLFIKPSEAK